MVILSYSYIAFTHCGTIHDYDAHWVINLDGSSDIWWGADLIDD